MESDGPDEAAERAFEHELLVRIGSSMTVAGEAVDEVSRRLVDIGHRRGIADVSVIALPTALLVQTGHDATARVQLESYPNRTIRLDQVTALYDVVHRVEDPGLSARDGLDQLDHVLALPPRRGSAVRVFGLGVLSVGFSLLLQPSVPGMAFAFVLGLLVGLMRLVQLRNLVSVMPYLAAFVVASIVFATADRFDTENPVRTLIPVLVTFIPGVLMTTGMRDMAAGEMISGSSRFVQAVVVLLMLAFSIVAAAALVGAPAQHLLDVPAPKLGPWAPWVGILVIALGTFLHHCAPAHAVPWIVAVMVVAYAGQALGAAVFSPELSSFFGALAMTPLVLFIDRYTDGPPALVTLIPGFWMLVPGSLGLIGITELIGPNSALGVEDFFDAITTVMEIAFGVLIGAGLFHTGRAGVHEAVKAVPTPVRRWSRRRLGGGTGR